MAGIVDFLNTLLQDANTEVKTIYADVAPIIAQGSSILHYQLPGDAQVKMLQSEDLSLTKQIFTLKGSMNQLLKTADASLKVQQDDLRSQATDILSRASDASKMLKTAIAAIQKIQSDATSGNVSIDVTSQIMSVKAQAEQMYQNSMLEISNALGNIANFVKASPINPAQAGVVSQAKNLVTGAVGAVIGTGADATRTGATALSQIGQTLTNTAPQTLSATAELLKYAPYLVGGAILLYGWTFVKSFAPSGGYSRPSSGRRRRDDDD
jgi:hypothetical protein